MSDRPQVTKRIREHDSMCLPYIEDGLENAMPLSGIVQYLESYNVPAPQGKYWNEKAVRRIIQRHNLRPPQAPDRQPADPAAPVTPPQAPDPEPDPKPTDPGPGRGTILKFLAWLLRLFPVSRRRDKQGAGTDLDSDGTKLD